MSTDGTFDGEDREMMRQGLASYSGRERLTLRRFVRTLLMDPVLREERILNLMMSAMDGRPAKRRAGNLRLVKPLCNESDDK